MTDGMAWAWAGQLLTLNIQPAGSARDGGVRWSLLRLVQVRRGRCVPYHIRASGIQEGHGSIESCTVTCVATDVRAAKSVVAHLAIWVTRSHPSLMHQSPRQLVARSCRRAPHSQFPWKYLRSESGRSNSLSVR